MSSPGPVSPVVYIRSKAAQFYAAAITTYALAVIAVALRVWARRLMRTRFWVDDWIIAVALLIASGFFINAIVWLHHGFGQPNEFLGEGFGKNAFTEDLLYFIVIGLVKISILAFYYRLFGASIRIPCYLLGAITICWEVAVILVTVFQCIPVSGYWNKDIPSKCIDDNRFFIGSSIANILTDLALLLLPTRYIWRLHRTTSQKLALAITFMLGGFVTIISIIRITILYKLNVTSFNLVNEFVKFVSWGIAESNMAIVAACLPSLRPILSLILYGEPNPIERSFRDRGLGRSWTRIYPSAAVHPHHGQPKITDDSLPNFAPPRDETLSFSGIEHYQRTALGDREDPTANEHEDMEMQTRHHQLASGIQVRTDVTVQ